MFWLRDELTAQETMTLNWRIHHSSLSVDEKKTFLRQLIKEVKIFRDLSAIIGYPELFIEFHEPLKEKEIPKKVPDYIIQHTEQIFV